MVKHMEVKGYNVTVKGDIELSKEEIKAYIDRGVERYGNRFLGLTLTPDEEFVDIEYDFKPQKFQRLRRITGYLVGSLDRWNNGKRSEERDRTKHGV